jgi:hypothetical protein
MITTTTESTAITVTTLADQRITRSNTASRMSCVGPASHVASAAAAAATARIGMFGGKLMKLSASIFCSYADAKREAPIRLARWTTWKNQSTHPP